MPVCALFGCSLSQRLKADTHYPYIRPVRTGAFLTPVHTARIYGCTFDTRINLRPVCTGVKKFTRIYGPYIRPVQVSRKIPEYVFANIASLMTLFVIRTSWIPQTFVAWYKEINVSTRSLSAQNCVSEHRGKYAASSSITFISPIRNLNKKLAI